jgi:hypothetical protein
VVLTHIIVFLYVDVSKFDVLCFSSFLQVVQDDALNGESSGSTVVLLMVRDAYANYVVQTAIDVVPEGAEKRMLIEELRANEVHLVSITSLDIRRL